MNKELEAYYFINVLINEYLFNGNSYTGPKVVVAEQLELIKKALKTLFIIKEKKVNVQFFSICLNDGWYYELFEDECQDKKVFEEEAPYVHSMTLEEWQLLKEFLYEC